MRHLLLLLAASCGAAPPATSTPPPATPPAPSPSCTAPEYRQLDFWIGDWDVVVKARQAPESDTWGEAKGTQRIESVLGGCAISEHFAAEGPGSPWAGQSYSMWVTAEQRWRQTWVDDQGGYLTFTGGIEPDGSFAFHGEPKEKDGVVVRMRMVWRDVTSDSLRWEWQRSVDDGASWTPMMVIEYRRRD